MNNKCKQHHSIEPLTDELSVSVLKHIASQETNKMRLDGLTAFMSDKETELTIIIEDKSNNTIRIIHKSRAVNEINILTYKSNPEFETIITTKEAVDSNKFTTR